MHATVHVERPFLTSRVALDGRKMGVSAIHTHLLSERNLSFTKMVRRMAMSGLLMTMWVVPEMGLALEDQGHAGELGTVGEAFESEKSDSDWVVRAGLETLADDDGIEGRGKGEVPQMDEWERSRQGVLEVYERTVSSREATEISAEGFEEGLERARRDALVAADALASDTIAEDSRRKGVIEDIKSLVAVREAAARERFRETWVKQMQSTMEEMLAEWSLAAGTLAPEDEGLPCQSEVRLANAIQVGYDQVVRSIQEFNAPRGDASKDTKIKLKVSGLDFPGFVASATALKQNVVEECSAKAAERAMFLAPEAFRSSLGSENLQGTADPDQMEVANFTDTLEWLNCVNEVVYDVCEGLNPVCLVDGPDDILYAAKQHLADLANRATALLTEMASFVSTTSDLLNRVSTEEADHLEDLRDSYPRALVSRVGPSLDEIKRVHARARSRIEVAAAPYLEAVGEINKGHQVASELAKTGKDSSVRSLASAAATNTISLELDPAGLQTALDIAFDRVDTEAAIAQRIVALRHEQWRQEQIMWLAVLSTLTAPLVLCALCVWQRRRRATMQSSPSRGGRSRRHGLGHESSPSEATSVHKAMKQHV